jgi:F-type H+-transporting ATPase subunit b
MTTFFTESFVVAICFLIFIYFAYKPIKKAIIASLDARIKEIKHQVTESKKLKDDAKNLLSEVEEKINSFEERKKSILASARTSNQRFVETKNKEMDLLLARKKDSAIKSIENETTKASNLMRKEFADNVFQLVTSYLKETKNNSASDQEIINHLIKNN